MTYLDRTIASPDVCVCHEAQQRICSPPFRVVFQTSGGEHRKTINDTSQSLGQDQGLKVGGNSFPLVVIWVGQPLERQFAGKKSIFWRYSVIAQDWKGREHNLLEKRMWRSGPDARSIQNPV